MVAKLRTWAAVAASPGLASSSWARVAVSSLVQVIGAGHDPPGDLAGLGGRRRGRGGELGLGPGLAVAAVGGAELAQVAEDGLDVAVPAAGPDLGVQGGGAGDAVVPPLVEVGLERVQDGGPAGGLDQQFVDAGGIGELGGGAAGQPQAAGDLADGAAFGAQRLDRGVAVPVPGDQPPLVAVHVAEPVRPGRAARPGCRKLRVSACRAGGGPGTARQARTVFSTASARFCHRWNRSATCTAAGAASRAARA